jgi:hypothetical protein
MANWGLALAKGLGMAINTENTNYAEQLKENRVVAKARYEKQIEADDAAYQASSKLHARLKNAEGNPSMQSRIYHTDQAIRDGMTGDALNDSITERMEAQGGNNLPLDSLSVPVKPKNSPEGWTAYMAKTKQGPLNSMIGEGIDSLFGKDDASAPTAVVEGESTPVEGLSNVMVENDSGEQIQTGTPFTMKGQKEGDLPFQAITLEGKAGSWRLSGDKYVRVSEDAIAYTPATGEVTAKSFGTFANPNDTSKRMSVANMSDGTNKATGAGETIPKGWVDVTGLPEDTDAATVTRQAYHRVVDGKLETRTVSFQGTKILDEDGKPAASLVGWTPSSESKAEIPEKGTPITGNNVLQYVKDGKPFTVDMRSGNPMLFGTETPFDLTDAAQTGNAPFPVDADVSGLTDSQPWGDQVTGKTVITYMTEDQGRVTLDAEGKRVPIEPGYMNISDIKASKVKGSLKLWINPETKERIRGIELESGEVIDQVTRKPIVVSEGFVNAGTYTADKPSALTEKMNMVDILLHLLDDDQLPDLEKQILQSQLAVISGDTETTTNLARESTKFNRDANALISQQNSSLDQIASLASIATAQHGGPKGWATRVENNLSGYWGGIVGDDVTASSIIDDINRVSPEYASKYADAFELGGVQSLLQGVKYKIAHSIKKGQRLTTNDLERVDTMFSGAIGTAMFAGQLNQARAMVQSSKNEAVLARWQNGGGVGASKNFKVVESHRDGTSYWSRIKDDNGNYTTDFEEFTP